MLKWTRIFTVATGLFALLVGLIMPYIIPLVAVSYTHLDVYKRQADISIASCIGVSACIPEMILKWGNDEQKDYFLNSYINNNSTPSILGFGITEPYGGTEATCPFPGRDRGCLLYTSRCV